MSNNSLGDPTVWPVKVLKNVMFKIPFHAQCLAEAQTASLVADNMSKRSEHVLSLHSSSIEGYFASVILPVSITVAQCCQSLLKTLLKPNVSVLELVERAASRTVLKYLPISSTPVGSKSLPGVELFQV